MATIIPAGFHALPVPLVQLSLSAVLKCGQSFRWIAYPLPNTNPEDIHSSNEYRFCLHDRVICLRQTPDMLFYRSVFPAGVASGPTHDAETLAWLRDYFQLDVDLPNLYDEWSKRDPVFAKLRSRFVGIRMLRQDPWENLVS
jgi:N-glycosylase/DNA lyase